MARRIRPSPPASRPSSSRPASSASPPKSRLLLIFSPAWNEIRHRRTWGFYWGLFSRCRHLSAAAHAKEDDNGHTNRSLRGRRPWQSPFYIRRFIFLRASGRRKSQDQKGQPFHRGLHPRLVQSSDTDTSDFRRCPIFPQSPSRRR